MDCEHQVLKGVRLPRPIVERIERLVREEGSTFSQFIRTAAIRELNLRKGAA